MTKIVFFGSGPVAAESLKLLSESFEIEAVITKPSTFDEMSKVVESRKYQVESKQQLDELFEKESFESKVAVLIDFGIIVSRKIIDAFPFGIVNSHFSLLPEWRGADPISFAILSGQKHTGVSLMLLTEKMDEGKILGSRLQVIGDRETIESLTEKLIKTSYKLILEKLPTYLASKESFDQIEFAEKEHGHSVVSYSRKLSKLDGVIDWSKPANVIEREIRAYQPWPRSRTTLGEIDVIIIKAEVDSDEWLVDSQSTRVNEDKSISVKCGNGNLKILELQPAGKKPMDIKAFLAGYGSRL